MLKMVLNQHCRKFPSCDLIWTSVRPLIDSAHVRPGAAGAGPEDPLWTSPPPESQRVWFLRSSRPGSC